MSTWDVFKWEAGEQTRPLTKEEFREKLEETVCQWVDAHPGADSGGGEAQDIIQEIGEAVEAQLEIFEIALKP